MVNWLIKLLGGFTIAELHAQVRDGLSSQQTLLSFVQGENASLKIQIEDLKKEKEFYREKIFQTPEIPQTETPKNLVPISASRIPWTRRKFMLERQDREKLLKESKSQVDQTEAQIRAKNARIAEQENAG